MEEEVKKSRTYSKRKVTNIVRKLKASLQYGAESEKIVIEVNYLEDNYDEMCSLHMEYEDLTEVDNEYLNEISSSYQNVLKEYYNSIKERKMIETMKEPQSLCWV